MTRAAQRENDVKAVQCKAFGDIGDLVVEDVAAPELGAGQVRVAVRAASVNFFDLLLVQGLYQVKPPLPFIPGSDAAGEVIELGPGVSGAKVGDRVVPMATGGAFAEQLVAPADTLLPIPDGVDFAQAAAYRGTYGTALYALEKRARLAAGEVLLVNGAAGGTGLAAVELGRLIGARVIGAVGSDQKFDIVRQTGAEAVINYETESVRDRVKELTGGAGADVIFDAVGGDVFDQSLRCIAWGGRLLVIGFTSGRIPSAPANLALLKGCSIVGVFYGSWMERDPEAGRELNQRLLGWIAEGRIRPHISMTFPLERTVEAMNALATRKAVGKVVITTA